MIYETSKRFIPIIRPDYSAMPFTLEIVSGSGKISISKHDSPTSKNFYYKKNDDTKWTYYSSSISCQVGDKISLSSNSTTMNWDEGFYYFSTGYHISANCYGNINSLVNFSNNPGYGCRFSHLFDKNYSSSLRIIDASNLVLPFTVIPYQLYYSDMFNSQYDLKAAPRILPATTLKNNCYYQMFAGCSSLIKAPYLPATELATNCYQKMFSECTNLTNINVNFTEWGNNTYEWVKNVAANGTFTCPSALIEGGAEYGINRIPTDWNIATK